MTTNTDSASRIGTSVAGIPASTRWLFPEYNFERMTAEEFFPVIVERILNRGSWAEIRWLLARYEQARIADWVQRHGYRRLDRKALHYWCWMLGVRKVHKPPWKRKTQAMS